MNVKRTNNQAGFSLVETIAAMGILALAAIPLLQLVNKSVRSSASLEQRFLARTVAENILVQETAKSSEPLDEALVQTGFSTQLGRQFNWVITASPVQEAAPQLVTVQVRMNEDVQLLAELTGLRLPSEEAFKQEFERRIPGAERLIEAPVQ